MSHFLPSLVNTGALAAAAGAAFGAATGDACAGALNGAGPERRVVFLWVCISAVTRFSSGMRKINSISI